jgi:hypothetical protein
MGASGHTSPPGRAHPEHATSSSSIHPSAQLLRLSPSSRARGRQAAGLQPRRRSLPPVRRRSGGGDPVRGAAVLPLVQAWSKDFRAEVPCAAPRATRAADAALPAGSLDQMHAYRRPSPVSCLSPSCLLHWFSIEDLPCPPNADHARKSQPGVVPAERLLPSEESFGMALLHVTQVQSQTTTADRSRAWHSQTRENQSTRTLSINPA